MGTEHPRLFFALWPDAHAAKVLHQRAEAFGTRCGGRVMREDSLHLTLAFLGNVDRARLPALISIADAVRVAPFNLVLDGVGYWSHNQLLWAGCESPSGALMGLADGLRRSLEEAGFPVQPESFVPHITLLRNTSQPPGSLAMAPMSWPVKEFVLVESHAHGNYQPLGHWSLCPQ